MNLYAGTISANLMDVSSTRENSALPALGSRTLILVERNLMTDAKKVSVYAGIISANPMDVLSTRENFALPSLGDRSLILVLRKSRRPRQRT